MKLIPRITQEIEEKIVTMEQQQENQLQTDLPPLSSQPNSNIVNLAVLVVFAIFAFVVKHMVQSLQWYHNCCVGWGSDLRNIYLAHGKLETVPSDYTL